MKRIMAILISIMTLIIGLAFYRYFSLDQMVDETDSTMSHTATPNIEPSVAPSVEPTPTPDFSSPDSLLILANKSHRLPEGYEPADLTVPNVKRTTEWQLREPAARAIEEMFIEASKDGVTLVLGSAFRSDKYQKQLWESYMQKYSAERADKISARPGYSEHQTGLAADIVQGMNSGLGEDFSSTFENTPEGKWMFENAHRFGWILRYPKTKEDITGYSYEPWHYRYVGKDIAEEMFQKGLDCTFEEHFHVEGGKEYK